MANFGKTKTFQLVYLFTIFRFYKKTFLLLLSICFLLIWLLSHLDLAKEDFVWIFHFHFFKTFEILYISWYLIAQWEMLEVELCREPYHFTEWKYSKHESVITKKVICAGSIQFLKHLKTCICAVMQNIKEAYSEPCQKYFWENCWRLKAVSYFRKNAPFRFLKRFWKCLWTELHNLFVFFLSGILKLRYNKISLVILINNLINKLIILINYNLNILNLKCQ